jgi:hypothetical protein
MTITSPELMSEPARFERIRIRRASDDAEKEFAIPDAQGIREFLAGDGGEGYVAALITQEPFSVTYGPQSKEQQPTVSFDTPETQPQTGEPKRKAVS